MRDTGPTLAVRRSVIDRLDRKCLRCWGTGQVIHHRRPRKRGGTRRTEINSPENLVWICLRCHDEIESNRAQAYDDGWLVKEGQDGPLEIHLIDNYGRELFLTDNGDFIYTGRIGIGKETT